MCSTSNIELHKFYVDRYQSSSKLTMESFIYVRSFDKENNVFLADRIVVSYDTEGNVASVLILLDSQIADGSNYTEIQESEYLSVFYNRIRCK